MMSSSLTPEISVPLTWEEIGSGFDGCFSYLIFVFSVELEGVFTVGWSILPNAINAALPRGPRDTGSVGTTSSGGGGVCVRRRGGEVKIEKCNSWGSGRKIFENKIFLFVLTLCS